MTLCLSRHKSAVPFPHKPLFFSNAGCLCCKAVPLHSNSRFFSSIVFFYILFIQSTLVNHSSNSLFLWAEFVTIQVLWLLPAVLQFISDFKDFLFSRLNV